MDIILNPTNKCNFNCTFCLARNLKNSTLSIDHTIKLLKRYEKDLNKLIINGGDPLMMPPDYYEKLLEYLGTLNHEVFVSFTTNLLDWYLNPKKWHNILSNHNVGVITSFQYGKQRRIKGEGTYTEDKFINIENKFYEEFGYRPNFISVINLYNFRIAHKNVELAKELGVKCKLNKLLHIGAARKTTQYFPRYKMLKLYCQIYDIGLSEYEMNTPLLKAHFNGRETQCPLNRNCYKGIRTINNDGTIYHCGNLVSEEEFNKYRINSKSSPDKFAKDNLFIMPKCIGCKNFKFCNACRMIIHEVCAKNDRENYCKQMRRVIPELKERFR